MHGLSEQLRVVGYNMCVHGNSMAAEICMAMDKQTNNNNRKEAWKSLMKGDGRISKMAEKESRLFAHFFFWLFGSLRALFCSLLVFCVVV